MTGETIGLGRSFGRGKQGGVRCAVPLPDLLIDTTGLTEIPNRTTQAARDMTKATESRPCIAPMSAGASTVLSHPPSGSVSLIATLQWGRVRFDCDSALEEGEVHGKLCIRSLAATTLSCLLRSAGRICPRKLSDGPKKLIANGFVPMEQLDRWAAGHFVACGVVAGELEGAGGFDDGEVVGEGVQSVNHRATTAKIDMQ